MSFPKKLLLCLAAVTAVCAFTTGPALASTKQLTIVEETHGLNSNPMATLETLKAMGVSLVKYSVDWRYLLPPAQQIGTVAPEASVAPDFYYGDFTELTQLDQDAAKIGIGLGFVVTGPVPKWAEGPAAGCTADSVRNQTCNPSDPAFGVFMAALGTYFSGSVPNVPAVRWWSIWDEPNYGVNLEPQLTGSSTYAGADQYRNLLAAAWTALTVSGHTTSTDTILFGELAARGVAGAKAATNAGIKPLQFLASLYCLSTAGKRLTGATATANACPASGVAFKLDNPALFDASGLAVHLSSQGLAPTTATSTCTVGGTRTACAATRQRPADPLWASFASVSNLEAALDRDVHAYGSSKKFAIWNTEYGYWTTAGSVARYHCKVAGQADCDVSPAQAEVYLNQAEYLSYKNPRIASFDQYQLFMPPTGSSAWSDGLLSAAGAREATFAAWELPLWIATTSLKRAGNLTVWGGLKPAYYNAATFKARPRVAIQFRARKGGWTTLKAQNVPASLTFPGGYFQSLVRVTQSGSIRLVYTGGRTTLISRAQAITVK